MESYAEMLQRHAREREALRKELSPFTFSLAGADMFSAVQSESYCIAKRAEMIQRQEDEERAFLAGKL